MSGKNQNFDAIVLNQYLGYKGNNSDLFWFKIGSYEDTK